MDTKKGIGYRVNGKFFSNPFLAFLEGAHNNPHATPRFVCYDTAFKDLDWTKEPEQSVRELIDARARQLANKYQKIVIAFSGGTDSMTVYNSFVRQNIFIDELIISYSPHTQAHPVANADWLIRNHPDKRTKITVMNRNDERYYTLFKDDGWILGNHGNLRYFNLSAPGEYFYKHCQDTWGNHNWCLIIGYEKPHILRENGQWLAVHMDKILQPALNWPNLEFFFLTPDFPQLHIKQNHMLLRYIKNNYSNFKHGWSSIAVCGKKSAEDYSRYASACGLDSELSPGQGFEQKKHNSNITITDVDSIMNNRFDRVRNIDPVLREKLMVGDSHAENFINGWQSLQYDDTLAQYMIRHGLLSSVTQPVENYNGMWGKKYVLEDK